MFPGDGQIPIIDDHDQYRADDIELATTTFYELVAYGKKYPAQYVVQNNALHARPYFHFPWVINNIGKVATAFQMLWWVSYDDPEHPKYNPTCRMAYENYPRDDCGFYDELDIAVNRGLDQDYLEIYWVDVLNPKLRPIIQKAYENLKPHR